MAYGSCFKKYVAITPVSIGAGGPIEITDHRKCDAGIAGKLLAELENSRKKLRNQDFLTKARPDVVEREHRRLAALEETLEKLKRAQESLRVTQR